MSKNENHEFKNIKYILTSTMRTKLIISIYEKEKNLEELRNELKKPSATILHGLKELENLNFVKKINKNYSLTSNGYLLAVNMLKLIENWYSINKNEIFWNRHDLKCIPKDLLKKLFSFSGWSVVGNIGFTLKDPLLNIILNLFFGPTINAAKGIATQVNTLVNSLATNFGMAMNPQIVKRYAAGDINGSMDLVYYGARLSFYLIMLISIPIIVNVDYILNLWLKDVPEYTNIFFIITILATLIYSLSGTSSVSVQATGKIKGFSIGVCIIPILDLPIAYILLYLGYSPYIALIPSIFTNFIALLFRFYHIKVFSKPIFLEVFHS